MVVIIDNIAKNKVAKVKAVPVLWPIFPLQWSVSSIDPKWAVWLCWFLEPVPGGCGLSVFLSPSLVALQEDRCQTMSSSFLYLTCLPGIQWCCPLSSTVTVLQSLGWNSLSLLAPSKKPRKLRSLFGHQMLGPAQQWTNLREQCRRRIKKNKTQK